MMDETATRRRHHNSKKQQSLHVASGGINDDDTHNLNNHVKNTSIPQPKQGIKRRRRKRRDEPPFHVLVFQVAVTLFLVCLASYRLYRWVFPQSAVSMGEMEGGEYYDDDTTNSNSRDIMQGENEESPVMDEEQKARLDKLLQAARHVDKVKELPQTAPPLPHFDLSASSQWDAFGVVERFLKGNTVNDNTDAKSADFWRAANGMRQRFAEIYGGDNAARMLLDRGMTTFSGFDPSNTSMDSVPADIVATACRLHSAKTERRPFRIAFGGYSVTAGRGNKFQDSFPFQLEKYLGAVLSITGINLVVNNAAIGGCPAFPYGFCMKNFWGESPDVVSWDYSMNEAGGVPEGLEAYVRHVLTTFPRNPPKLIVKDTHMATQRRDVLGSYESLLRDPVVIHTDPAVQPFLDRKEAHRPVGFQQWRKFSAPVGAPGQASHHPAVKEHELIGWILAMHFLTSLEYLVSQGENLKCPASTVIDYLPPPVSGSITNATDIKYESILFGHEKDNGQWHMHPVQCRTTFQPIISGDLSEIVVSGTTAEDVDILLPKSQMYYNQGWTLDLSEDEKAAKRKLSIYENGLGFVDSKEAYYGIFESPKMNLLMPSSQVSAKIGDVAGDWFESIVLCQVNEKRDSSACNFGSDIGVVIGGVNATSTRMMEDAGTLYLGQQMCLHIDIPDGAILTSHNQLAPQDHLEKDVVGVMVEVSVTNPHIAHVKQACSVSHAIWQDKRVD